MKKEEKEVDQSRAGDSIEEKSEKKAGRKIPNTKNIIWSQAKKKKKRL